MIPGVVIAAHLWLSTPEITRLQNGLTLLMQPSNEPVCAVRFCARVDTSDPTDFAAAELLSLALTQETDPLELLNMQRLAWGAGGDLFCSFSSSLLSMDLIVPPDRVNIAVSLVGKMFRKQNISNLGAMAAFQRYSKRVAKAEDDPCAFATRLSAAELNLGACEINPPNGQQLDSYKSRLIKPERCTLAVVGAFDQNELTSYASKALGNWTVQETRTPKRISKAVTAAKPAIKTVSMAIPGPAPNASEFASWLVGYQVFSSGKSSELYRKMRLESGAVYRWSSDLIATKTGCMALISLCSKHKSDQLLELAKTCVADANMLDSERIESAKSRLLFEYDSLSRGGLSRFNAFEFGHTRPEDRAFWLTWWELLGGGAKADSKFAAAIARVTVDEVRVQWQAAVSRVKILEP